MPEEINAAPDAEQKREAARLALEGAEWTAKRETHEKIESAQEETATLQKRLEELRQEKEKLELAWIDLDDKKRALRAVLNPILDEEKKLEEEENKLEAEEAGSGVPEVKHATETKRWPVQDKRKEIEQKKWAEEQKVIALDQTIAANTKKYRALLEEEDKILTRLDQVRAAALVNQSDNAGQS